MAITRKMDNTEKIAEMQDKLADVRELLQDFEREQDDSSDEGNEDHILSATASLDSLEGAIEDLVP